MTGLGGERFRLFLTHLVDLFNGAVLLTASEFDVDYLVDDGDVVFVNDEVQDSTLSSLMPTHELSHMLDQEIHDKLRLSTHPPIC